jgi:hypothetical protein
MKAKGGVPRRNAATPIPAAMTSMALPAIRAHSPVSDGLTPSAIDQRSSKRSSPPPDPVMGFLAGSWTIGTCRKAQLKPE